MAIRATVRAVRQALPLAILTCALPALSMQPPTQLEAERLQKECSMRAQIVAGITSRHNAHMAKDTAAKEILASLTRFKAGDVPIRVRESEARLWVVKVVDRVYATPRTPPGVAPTDAMELQELCMRNPDLYATPSMVDWAATDSGVNTLSQ